MVTLLDDISIPHLLGLSSFSLYLILFSVLVSREHPRCVHVQRPGNLDETTCTSCLSESAPVALSSVNVPRHASILSLAWTNSTQAICAIHLLRVQYRFVHSVAQTFPTGILSAMIASVPSVLL